MTHPAEDLEAYVDIDNGFSTQATLQAATVIGILNTATAPSFDGSVMTQEPSFVCRTSDAPTAAPSQTLVADAVTYTVRRVERLPPDGAMTSLTLARA